MFLGRPVDNLGLSTSLPPHSCKLLLSGEFGSLLADPQLFLLHLLELCLQSCYLGRSTAGEFKQGTDHSSTLVVHTFRT